ncbi:MAG: hypothetical protein DMH00_10085 [Acidobacteria bacterium]|nr:MAG: hypothetical protein DMH00_10085 [Acidobacteriota bacterium]
MRRIPDHRRTRFWIGWISLTLAILLCSSVRPVREGTESVIRECHIPGSSPQLIGPGWRFSPLGLCRLTRYPTGPQRISFNLPDTKAGRLSTQEGVSVRVRGAVSYRLPPASALQMYLLSKSQAPSKLLGPLLSVAVAEEVRAASFSRISGAHRIELEASLARRLGAQFRERRMLFQSAQVDSVRMERTGAGTLSPEAIPGSRLLVLGLDGADWRIIDPLLRQGRLPTLARLIRHGVRARLKSVDPVLSPVVWTTAATGFLPSDHGILDFLVRDTRSGQEVPVTSRHRKVKAIWNLLSDSGVAVGIIGWWATWPAEFVDGYIVSDRVAYQLFSQYLHPDSRGTGKTFPPNLYEKILPLLVRPEQVSLAEMSPFVRSSSGPVPATTVGKGSREEEFRTVLAATKSYESIAMALGSNGFQAFEAIYFEGIDTTSHLFMPFRPPMRPGVSEVEYRRYSQVVDAFYSFQDSILGKILEKAGAETGVMILSDHGFKSESDRPLRDSRVTFDSAALWHRKDGILIVSGGWFREGGELPELSVLDITPTILTYFGLPVGEDMQGRPIRELFREEFLHRYPVAYRPSWESQKPVNAEAVQDPEGDRVLKEKLMSLGYLSREGDLSSNNLGNALLAEGKTDQAIVEFRKAVHAMPSLVLTHVNLGRALLAKDDLPSARREIEAALKLDPSSPEGGVLMAHVEMAEEKGSEAERRLKSIVLRDPSVAGAHKALGNLYLSKGDGLNARQAYERALALDPEDAETHNNLGILFHRQGQTEEAEREFRKSSEADPGFAEAYNNLALIALERHDHESARQLLQRAQDLAPDNPAVHNNRGNLFEEQGDLQRAEAEYRRALTLRSLYAEPHNGLGAILKDQGKVGEAEAEFRLAISISAEYADARINLAHLLERNGRIPEAERELRQFLVRVPGHPAVSLDLATLILGLGRPSEAAEVCTVALNNHARETTLWNLRGESLRKMGRILEAAEAYRRSLEINPLQPQIALRLKETDSGASP